VFKQGTTTLLSNLATVAFDYKKDTGRYTGQDGLNTKTDTNFITTFIPQYDIVRGTYLPNNVYVCDLGYKNIVPGSVQFVCVSDTDICVHSLDRDGEESHTHLCKRGFAYAQAGTGGRYYYDFCTNSDCPLYLSPHKYKEGLFASEVAFINGAIEFERARTTLHSIDYSEGKLYTSFKTPTEVIATLKASSHKAEYNIVKPLDWREFRVLGNNVKLTNRELIAQDKIKLAVKYRRRVSLPEVISKLREYFTPILRTLKVRVGRNFE